MSIRDAWSKVTNLGVDEEKLGREVVKVRILNQVIFVTLITSVLVLLVYLVTQGSLTIILTTAANIGFESAGLFASYKKKHKLARFLSFIIFPSWMGINVLLNGGGFGEANIFSAMAFCAFIMYEGERKQQIPVVIYITSIFIFSKLYIINFGSNLERSFNPYDDLITFPLILVILGLIILLYQREIKKFEEEQEELINDLANKNNALLQLNDELEQFTYLASHDLKTPLRTISTRLDLIKMHISNNDLGAIQEDISFAKQGTKQIYSLINDILEYQQLSNREEVIEKIDLNEVIRKVTLQIDSFIKEKNAKIKSSNLPIITAYSQDLIFLFQNLIENAIKYNKSETPLVNIYSQINDSHLELFFEDNGIGIEDIYQDKIFQFFKRLHNNDEYEGTGIGLGICRKIANKYKGKISMNSRPNGGSVFKIVLPKNIMASHLV